MEVILILLAIPNAVFVLIITIYLACTFPHTKVVVNMYVVMVHSNGKPDSFIFDDNNRSPAEYVNMRLVEKAIQEHYVGDNTATYHVFQEVATLKPTFEFQPIVSK